jgi:peptidoglycan/xylan/chitin deacetylase (PgdA/CDA1 family)
MRYSKQLHSRNHLIKSVLGNLLFPVFGFPHQNGDLLVLNLHSVPHRFADELRHLIEFLGKHFALQSPDYLGQFYHGAAPKPGTQPSVVFTFDDGLRNNFRAAQVLEEFGIRGLFFVVPDFFQAAEDAQESYYRTHIRNLINPHYDREPEDFRAMNIEQLLQLKALGHELGSHSMSHTMNKEQDHAALLHEVVHSKEVIDRVLQQNTTHFCAPFNSLQRVSAAAMQLISSHYSYFHSTFPGSNLEDRNPMFIRRVNVEAFWLMGAVKYACSGREWQRWRDDSARFQNLSTNLK